jgi:hypothetical protein
VGTTYCRRARRRLVAGKMCAAVVAAASDATRADIEGDRNPVPPPARLSLVEPLATEKFFLAFTVGNLWRGSWDTGWYQSYLRLSDILETNLWLAFCDGLLQVQPFATGVRAVPEGGHAYDTDEDAPFEWKSLNGATGLREDVMDMLNHRSYPARQELGRMTYDQDEYYYQEAHLFTEPELRRYMRLHDLAGLELQWVETDGEPAPTELLVDVTVFENGDDCCKGPHGVALAMADRLRRMKAGLNRRSSPARVTAWLDANLAEA